MFALFEAGLQQFTPDLTPRLRRCAPYLGLIMLAPFGDLNAHID